MLGFILYETFDVVYHIGKLGVNGTISLYNWYYKDEKDKNKETSSLEMINTNEQEIKNEIYELRKRITDLENENKLLKKSI